jgi:Arc/MetJ family transcription regulator
MIMRTNIELNDALVEEAFAYAGVKTKKALIHKALQEFVERRKRLDVRELRGKVHIRPDYDYKRLREG